MSTSEKMAERENPRFTQPGSNSIYFWNLPSSLKTPETYYHYYQWLALPYDRETMDPGIEGTLSGLAYWGSTIVGRCFKDIDHDDLSLIPGMIGWHAETGYLQGKPESTPVNPWDKILRLPFVAMRNTGVSHFYTALAVHEGEFAKLLEEQKPIIPFLRPRPSPLTSKTLSWAVGSASPAPGPDIDNDQVARYIIRHDTRDDDLRSQLQASLNEQTLHVLREGSWPALGSVNRNFIISTTGLALDVSLVNHTAVYEPMVTNASKVALADREVLTDDPGTINAQSKIEFSLLVAILEHWNLEADCIDSASSQCVESLKSGRDLIPLDISTLEAYASLYSERRNGFMIPSGHSYDVGIQPSAAHESINTPYDIYPRRLWDLKTNIVIPAYLVEFHLATEPPGFERWTIHKNRKFPEFVAISHSWCDGQDLQLLETPINHFAWPVPIPRDLNLNDLRQELVQKFPTIRYCWLDVLCLRQMETRVRPNGTEQFASHAFVDFVGLGTDYKGNVRAEELRIDVPTIGNVYVKAKFIYRFFNGLGREAVASGWDGARHWMNRAWTLQENVPGRMVDGGLPSEGPYFYNVAVTHRGATKRVREFMAKLAHTVSTTSTSVIALAAEMEKRYAANDVDKIAGLSYLLGFRQLPTYSAGAPEAVAWQRCISNMNTSLVAELFWNCPLGGDPGTGSWIPSWSALRSCPPTFVPYEPDSRKLSEHDGGPALGGLSWNGVWVVGVDRIQCVAQGDYLISVKFAPWASGSTSIRFFISHDKLEVDRSLHHPRNDRRDSYLVLVSLAPGSTDQCSTWVLLERPPSPAFTWRKVSVLRTDEDVSGQGTRTIQKLDALRLVGPPYRDLVIVTDGDMETLAYLSWPDQKEHI